MDVPAPGKSPALTHYVANADGKSNRVNNPPISGPKTSKISFQDNKKDERKNKTKAGPPR